MAIITRTALCALAATLLLGCDHGAERLAKGASAEVAGNFEEAATQYRAACDEGSSLCPTATRRLERMKLAEADRAIVAGEYRKAKAAIDQALASSDEGVKRAALVMSKLPDLQKGLAWEEAASAKPDDALVTMEKLARDGFTASSKAREWLAKNRLGILMGRIEAVCTGKGTGSCVEMGREIARLYPGSPESAKASKLVEADYARIFPLLQKAEGLLARRADIYLKDEKVRWCMWDATNEAASNSDTFESRNYMEPDEARRPQCESTVSPEPMPAIDEAWRKALDEIRDPTFTRPLQDRLQGAEKRGLYTPEVWPKPAGQK